jgi:peptide/nickel transport system substrate-binding protein
MKGKTNSLGGISLKRWFIVSTVALSMVILLSPCTPQAANSTASTTMKAATSSTTAKPPTNAKANSTATQPQSGGIFKVIIRTNSNVFGYPPRMVGAAKDYAPPFFDHLLSVGDDGKYQPGLALSWDVSSDGKAIIFKLRQGVTFHDGTPFNAQAVKSNVDNLIPPNAKTLSGITSVDVVDDYTVKLNLPAYNNLILHHFATNPATYMYSSEALKKNGADWAATHPVGTGPFMLKEFQPNVSLTLVKNPNYWQKGLPYLDGIAITQVTNPMTQMLTLKAGQAHAIYAVQEAAAQLRDEGYPWQSAPGTVWVMNFDTKNSEIFSKPQVRQAIEYAIDKEAICSGPGQGLYKPVYQIVSSDYPAYNPACPPRKYNPAKAKKLLAEAGYPTGFSFKVFMLDTSWKDGWIAIQSYLDKVGIKMEINSLNVSGYELIRAGGKIEKGAAVFASFTPSSNALFTLDSFWRSDSNTWPYVVKPAGIDKLIDQAKLSRDPAAITKINRQIIKLIYDDETIIPFYQNSRIAVVDKSVQNTGWFIYGDAENNQFGHRTWLKK